MSSLENRSAVLQAKNFQNSLLNSLLAGNLGRERLAPDCLLRQSSEISSLISRLRNTASRTHARPRRIMVACQGRLEAGAHKSVHAQSFDFDDCGRTHL